MAARWVLHRAGIVNVYQYGDETLHFAGGRLLLRGVNGSGKSTAMNMLLPFLLDADTRRIDAAGEQSSVLRSWMLTGRDDPQPSGYLWLEVARQRGDGEGGDGDRDEHSGAEHLVFGCGIRANRSTERVTTWWFVTTQRPGIDFALVEGRVPLSVDALRATLGAHAVFAQDQRAAYRNEIRSRLFGGADLDQHIRLLHVVRSPRVGDRIDVELPDHLVGALPQLSDAAIDDAAQPLEDLEEHRRNVEDLTRTAGTLDALDVVYRGYARSELRRRAELVLERFEQVRRDRRAAATARTAAGEAATALEAARTAHDELKADRNRLDQEIQALIAQPAYREGQQLDDLRGRVAALADAQRRAELLVTRHRRGEAEAAARATQAEATVLDDLARLSRDLGELATAGREARLPAAPGPPALDRGEPQQRPIDPDAPSGRAQEGDDGGPAGPDVVAVPQPGFDVEPVRRGIGAVHAGVQQRQHGAADLHQALDGVDAQATEVRSAERARAEAEEAAEAARAAFSTARRELDAAVGRWQVDLGRWADEVDALGAPADAEPPAAADAAADADTEPSATPPRPEGAEPAPAAVDRSVLDLAALRTRGDEVEAALDAAAAAHVRHHERALARLAARRRTEAAEVARLTAERDELMARTEPEPPRAWWQRDDRAATLAELVDFAPGLEAAERAGLEAALEASGLLGAEVHEGGLSLATGELVALPGDPVAAPLGALLEVTLPEGAADVDRAKVAAVLGAISTDTVGAGPTAVAVDGSFRIGALRGRHAKPVAEHIGVTARLAALARARRAVQHQLDEATATLAATDRDAAEVEARREGAEAVRRRRPPARAVLRAARDADLAEERLGDARDRAAGCRQALDRAEEAHATLAADSQRLAARLGLPADRSRLRAVEVQLAAIVGQCHRVEGRLVNLGRSHHQWVIAAGQWREAADELGTARDAHEQRRAEHEPQAMRLATLEDSIGAEYGELLASLDLSRREQAAVVDRLGASEAAVTGAVRHQEQARGRAAVAAAERDRSEAACVATLGPLRGALALPGLVTAATAPAPSPTPGADAATAAPGATATPDAALSADAAATGERPAGLPAMAVAESADGARDLATAVLDHVPPPERVGATAEGVRQSLRQRRDQLGAGWDAEDHQPDERLPLTIEVTGPLVGSRVALADAASAVRDQLQQQSSLLTAKQDQALRNLLQGLVAREVSDKMHAAHQLVDMMNRRLGTVTTAHGIGASLRWRRRDDLDEELATTIALLAKPPDLRTADEDRSLARALSTRIDRARANDPEAPYRALIGEVLDYRAWHTMAVMIHRAGDTPRLLSRRTALSEGEKKVVSYLPLFAAVAASCDALAAHDPSAPRFVLLDDAFAKVSEDNHPRLFGLLVQLDLDFIATSERLWGTHGTVPELAITEVLRDADLNVIVLEHSRWDGRTLAHAGAAP